MKQESLFVSTVKGNASERIPFWFMRQAGRYLPEYRALRAMTGGFLDLCFDSEKAAEVTLQPLRRFNMDAAILFSDILVVPYGLGVDVRFAEGEGPIVAITDTAESIAAMRLDLIREKLEPIAETVRLVKKQMPQGAALIGFAGSPWTVACYMLQGKSGKEFAKAREFAYAQPALMQALMDVLCDATIEYLRMQIDAGAEVIQLFDSWAGLLPPSEFIKWSVLPTKKIIAALNASHASVPIIGFAKGAALNLPIYAHETGANCIGIDQHTPMEFGIYAAKPHQAVQGNLDPLLLANDKDGALRETEKILTAFGTRAAIFNVGHGFVPHTPIENVQAVSDMVRAWRR
jgi:uroporphyrinogen decarboxylase